MFKSLDKFLLAAFLLASLISLSVIASIAPDRLLTQALSLAMGLLIFIYLSRQDPALFTSFAKLGYPLALLLLVLNLVLGDNVRGSIRWINLGGFHLQSSELVKPLLILYFAHFLTTHPPQKIKNLLISIALLIPPLLLILRQPDLGTTLVILVIFVGQLFVAGAPWLLFALGGIISLLGIYYSPHLLHDYQLRRIESFLDPASDPLGSGYNVIQSTIAVGSGGIFGKGLGAGTQSHLQFLPERHTDFIFASLMEELGLFGGVFTLAILTLILYRMVSLMLSPLSQINRLILSGVFFYLLFQTFVNVGMNLGIMPVTGVTLPLISYGGSSIITISLTLGIAGSIASSTRNQDYLEIK